jgi:hypothetical protein
LKQPALAKIDHLAEAPKIRPLTMLASSTSGSLTTQGRLRRRQEELVRRNSESLCQLFEVVERDVPHLSLDMRNKSAMKTSLKCKRFLTPLMGGSQRNDVHSQYRPDIGTYKWSKFFRGRGHRREVCFSRAFESPVFKSHSIAS